MAGIPDQGRVLSPGEEKALDRTLTDLKDMRDQKEVMQGVTPEVKDKAALDKRISELERVRQNHSIPKLSGAERERVLNELEILQADLQVGMPSWSEYEGLRPRDGARYSSLVKWIVSSQADRIRQQKVQRWKVLRRMANPDDPQAGNTMYLFPQK